MAESKIKKAHCVETEDSDLKMRYVKLIRLVNQASGDFEIPLADFQEFSDIASKAVYVIPSIGASGTSMDGIIIGWNTYGGKNTILIHNSIQQDLYINLLVFYTL